MEHRTIRDLRLFAWTQGVVAGLVLLGSCLGALTTPISSAFRLLGVEKPPFPVGDGQSEGRATYESRGDGRDPALSPGLREFLGQPFPEPSPRREGRAETPPMSAEEVRKKWGLEPGGERRSEYAAGREFVRQTKPGHRMAQIYWIATWVILPVVGIGVGAGATVLSLRRLLDEFLARS